MADHLKGVAQSCIECPGARRRKGDGPMINLGIPMDWTPPCVYDMWAKCF